MALLKVNFDIGRDHLSMFEPFVTDTVARMPDAALAVNDVREAIIRRHDLALPTNTLRTLLDRAAKKGYLRREGGRYFRLEHASPMPDLAKERERVEARQAQLAEALRNYLAERGTRIDNNEDALSMVLDFLQRYHVSLALDLPASLEPSAATESDDDVAAHRRAAQTAAFLLVTVTAPTDLSNVVQEMLEGFILQNALFLKDISSAARKFTNLRVFCDSILLFGALGYRGAAVHTATRELLALLVDTGAILNVFEPTIEEMRRILDVYEQRLATSEGRAALYPTDLTRYFLTTHYSPSDIRTARSLLPRHLRALGLNIREVPAHQARFTLDEEDLAARLAERRGGENEPRVVHDIDCVAGVLTLRAGRTTSSLDDAGAIFVSTNPRTVRVIADWYQEQDGDGVVPIIHSLVLSNLAWLKRPASATKLKLHELVALCTAALRPTRRSWRAFQRHLKKLSESGELSSDEVTAIIVSGLTEAILVDEEIDEDSDAATLMEVIERVKSSYRGVADLEIDAAKADAARSEAEAVQLRLRVDGRIRAMARIASWSLAATLTASFLAGTVIGIIDAVRGAPPGLAAVVLALAPLAVAGVLSLLWGFNLAAWRRRVEGRIVSALARWFIG